MPRLVLTYACLVAALFAAWTAFGQVPMTGAGLGAPGGGGGGGCGTSSAPSLDASGSFTHASTAGTTTAITYSTTSTNDIVLVISGNNRTSGQGSATTVLSVSDTAGLTWANRKQFSGHLGGNPWVNLEIWWALAASAQSSQTITITFNATIDNASTIVLGVNGAKTSTPWDTNGSIPATGIEPTNTTAPTVSSVSTTCVKDMLVMAAITSSGGINPPNQTTGTGFSSVTTINSSGGADFSASAVQTGIVTSAQSGITTSFGTSWAAWVAISDALQGL